MSEQPTQSSLEKKTEQLTNALLGLGLAVVFLSLLIFIWNSDLLTQTIMVSGERQKLAAIVINYPKWLSFEDSGEIGVSIRNTATHNISVTIVISFDLMRLSLRDQTSSSSTTFTNVLPGEIRFTDLSVRTIGDPLTIGQPITKTTLAIATDICCDLASGVHLTSSQSFDLQFPSLKFIPALRSILVGLDSKLIGALAFALNGSLTSVFGFVLAKISVKASKNKRDHSGGGTIRLDRGKAQVASQIRSVTNYVSSDRRETIVESQ